MEAQQAWAELQPPAELFSLDANILLDFQTQQEIQALIAELGSPELFDKASVPDQQQQPGSSGASGTVLDDAAELIAEWSGQATGALLQGTAAAGSPGAADGSSSGTPVTEPEAGTAAGKQGMGRCA